MSLALLFLHNHVWTDSNHDCLPLHFLFKSSIEPGFSSPFFWLCCCSELGLSAGILGPEPSCFAKLGKPTVGGGGGGMEAGGDIPPSDWLAAITFPIFPTQMSDSYSFKINTRNFYKYNIQNNVSSQLVYTAICKPTSKQGFETTVIGRAYPSVDQWECHWILRTKIRVFLDVKPCSLVHTYGRFGGRCCLHIDSLSVGISNIENLYLHDLFPYMNWTSTWRLYADKI